MKRSCRFAVPQGHLRTTLGDGGEAELPVFQGILKHPRAAELPGLLSQPAVAEKYTRLAIQTASWPILREFPAVLLRRLLPGTPLRPARKKALLFLLDQKTG